MKKLLCTLAIFCLLNNTAWAATSVVINKQVAAPDIKTASILFTGLVSQAKIVDLEKAIDTIVTRYKSVKNIYLYINSHGGNTNAAKEAYYIIKSSPIDITTVNVGATESAASLLFCAAKTRLALPGTFFLLHDEKLTGQPQTVESEYLNFIEDKFASNKEGISAMYKTCSNFSEDEINRFLFSENQHLLLDNSEALKTQLVTAQTEKISLSDISIYIFDADKNSHKTASDEELYQSGAELADPFWH